VKTVSVPLELPETTILYLALEAHKLDITLNAFMLKLIEAYIEKESTL
jgi:hypothetical protein